MAEVLWSNPKNRNYEVFWSRLQGQYRLLDSLGYGYDVEHDVVVIRKDGNIGEIYEIQGLKVAIPKTPININGSKLKKEDQVFIRRERPGSLNKIKTSRSKCSKNCS